MSLETKMQLQVDLSRVGNLMTWNRQIFSVVGLWPLNIDDRLFAFFFVYLAVHCSLECADLIQYIDHLDYVISNLTENITMTMVLVKLGTFRLNAKRLCRVLEDIQGDYEIDRYKTREERLEFLKYNNMAKNFIKVAIPSMAMGTIMFYLKPVMGHMAKESENSSTSRAIPYHIRLFFEITEIQTYIIVYVCQMPIIPIVTFGYTGLDCLLVTLMLHLCGQLSVLKHQVKNVMDDPEGYHHGMTQLIVKHVRLIRLAKSMDAAFNMLLLQQLLGSTIAICFIGYKVLSDSESGDKVYFITHLICVTSMIVTLFGYCFVGECLINESVSLSDYLYSLDWYDIPTRHSKLLLTCISRAQSPLVLTAGRFYVFSLQSFTDVMKTSMAYLSVLRTFL
uniref:Odorant receptor n=1 Tax=Sirex nitobei TaxID=1602346 RepID=A0A857NA14_9HYME|nr:odorant receptor 24 [Sirex nitobei]